MKRTDIEPAIVATLEEALIGRDVMAGFALLDKISRRVAKLVPEDPQAISLLLGIAQCVDLGYRDLAFLESTLERFSHLVVSELPLIDFLRLRSAQAFLCLSREEIDEAIAILEMTLRAGVDLMPKHLAFISHFWKGRAHRKKGEYQHAVLHISAARKVAEQVMASKLVAVTKIHESWLVFQKGEQRRAFRLLDEAEEQLRSTGDTLSLGNIESARGRFVRRSGEYARALTHFETAIAIYSTNNPNHRNHARALVNAAYVKRLIALDMRSKFRGEQARGAAHARHLQISTEALDLLKKAGDIYAMHHHQGGTGSVLVNAGHLHLESGAIDLALTEGRKAYRLGEEKHDQILMSRARILQALVELAFSDEQLGDHPDVFMHANLATAYAEQAIELATHTQNRRLLAEAYIARGVAATSDVFQQWDIAKSYAAKAADLLGEGDRDHLFKELGMLKEKILRFIGIDHTLRSWSDGDFGDKTFQQIQEEFAEMVIPKIWMREEKNITRVAQKLSISPKKVRRLLRNTGYLDR
jgi:tetratricopeptide (TPR) repeat protein